MFQDFAHAYELLHEAILAKTRYLMLTGESGTGKTTLMDYLRQHLDRCLFRVVYLHFACLNGYGLVRVLARHFRVPPRRSPPETVQALTAVIEADPSFTLVWIDEADLLPDNTFAELRALVESDLAGATRLCVLVAGLPALRDRLQAPHLFPFWRRLQARLEITGLQADEARAFATHHLGAKNESRISDEALAFIFEKSRGVPGLLIPYLDRVARAGPKGTVSIEAAKTTIQQWDLA
jgi:type II secretory pathway predicted ATPase ExeA